VIVQDSGGYSNYEAVIDMGLCKHRECIVVREGQKRWKGGGSCRQSWENHVDRRVILTVHSDIQFGMFRLCVYCILYPVHMEFVYSYTVSYSSHHDGLKSEQLLSFGHSVGLLCAVVEEAV